MPKRTISAAILCGVLSLAPIPTACTHTNTHVSFATAKITAWAACRHFVKKQLEARTSAQFPLMTDPQVAVVPLAPNQWLVQGYVDVRDDDDTGARLRVSFLCQVDFQPETLTVQQIRIDHPEQFDI